MKYNKKDIQVLYNKEYIGRILFVLLYKGEMLQVYKSSGFSGTGHKDMIIPFFYLSEKATMSIPQGYIFKHYYKDSRLRHHYKQFYNEDKEFLEFLADVLEDYKVQQTLEEMDEIVESPEFSVMVQDINEDLKSFEYPLFDFANLIKN